MIQQNLVWLTYHPPPHPSLSLFRLPSFPLCPSSLLASTCVRDCVLLCRCPPPGPLSILNGGFVIVAVSQSTGAVFGPGQQIYSKGKTNGDNGH